MQQKNCPSPAACGASIRSSRWAGSSGDASVPVLAEHARGRPGRAVFITGGRERGDGIVRKMMKYAFSSKVFSGNLQNSVKFSYILRTV